MVPVIQNNVSSKDVPDDCSLQVYSDVPVEIAGIIFAKTGQNIAYK
jgi:hypothetical protein